MSTAKQSREERRRRREYEARLAVNDHQQSRTKRDNVVALSALGVVALLAAAAQLFFFVGGPGAPQPSTTASADATATPAAQVPDAGLAEGRTWTGTVTFNDALQLGVELDGAAAPQAVANLVTLSQEGFYDGTSCHRLTTEGLYVLQCGDPTATGSGGPGYTFGPIENAPEDGFYPAGTIAMARSSAADSQGSQFFIVYADTYLDTSTGGYSVFGSVTSGLDELTAQIVSQGTADGSTDGAPLAQAVISGITLE